MLLLTHSKHQYYDFFLWMSWCIVIEAENTSQMLEEYDSAPQRTVLSQNPFHSPVSFIVCIFTSKATCPHQHRYLCSKTLSGYLRHSIVSAYCFPPLHDTPGFLCQLNPVCVSTTGRGASHNPDATSLLWTKSFTRWSPGLYRSHHSKE